MYLGEFHVCSCLASNWYHKLVIKWVFINSGRCFLIPVKYFVFFISETYVLGVGKFWVTLWHHVTS